MTNAQTTSPWTPRKTPTADPGACSRLAAGAGAAYERACAANNRAARRAPGAAAGAAPEAAGCWQPAPQPRTGRARLLRAAARAPTGSYLTAAGSAPSAPRLAAARAVVGSRCPPPRSFC